MTAAGFNVIRWARDTAPFVRRHDGKTDAVARLVLIVLATYADKQGQARPSLRTLAEAAGLAERTTMDALGRLVAAKLVSEAGTWNGLPVWRLDTSLTRGEDDATEAERRLEKRREADRQRQRRRRSKDAGHAAGERDVTSSESVTETGVTPSDSVSHAVGQRDVTLSTSLHPQVSTPVTAIRTAIELPYSAPPAPETEDDGLFATEQAPAPKPPAAPDVDALFAEFWKVYPKRDKKQGAVAAFRKAVLGHGKGSKRVPPVDPAVILAAAKRYALAREGQDPQYTQLPPSWLNQARWEDESLTTVADVTSLDGAPAGAMTEQQAREWLQQEWRIGRPQFVAQRTGIEYPQADPPPDVSSKDIPDWRRQRARDWITSVYDAAMAALTRKAAS